MALPIDLGADDGPMLRRLAIAMTVLSTLSIALRFWSRAVATRTKFWWDDWLALLAWVCLTVLVHRAIVED